MTEFKKVGIPFEEYTKENYYLDAIGNYRYIYDPELEEETFNDYDINGNIIHRKVISPINPTFECWFGYDDNNNEIFYMNNQGQKIIREYNLDNKVIKEKNYLFKFNRIYHYNDDTIIIETFYKENIYRGKYIKEIRYPKLGYSVYFDKYQKRWAKIHRDKNDRIILYEDSSNKYFRAINDGFEFKDEKGSFIGDEMYIYMDSLAIFKNKWFSNKKVK